MIYLKADVGGGMRIDQAIKAAKRFVLLHPEIAIQFVHNGVTVTVHSETDEDEAHQSWERTLYPEERAE